MAKARFTVVSEVSRLPNSMRFLPRTTEAILSIATAKVLVFIPPPVEAGEAPIQINNVMNSIVDKCKRAKSMVATPPYGG